MSSTGDGEPKPTHHFGRGGAGNVTKKDPKSPSLPPTSTPTLKADHYTTGRGGTGNIVENTGPQESRAAQDVDVPGIALPEGDRHTGRGGAANKYRPGEDEIEEAREHNAKLRSDSAHHKDRSALKNLKEKGKEILAPNRTKDGQ